MRCAGVNGLQCIEQVILHERSTDIWFVAFLPLLITRILLTSSSKNGINIIRIMAITHLMRLAETSSQFTDNENAYEIEKAIDRIVAADPQNIYEKLKIEVKDEDTLDKSA